MALKKPVIGSDVGGIAELITDEKTGLLFKADDVQDLAEKCLYALNNQSKMTQIVEDARRHVEIKRNWQTISERYLTMYRKLGANVPDTLDLSLHSAR